MGRSDIAAPSAGDRVDAARDAVVCWWSGNTPREITTHPIEGTADGGWTAVAAETAGEWYIGLEWTEPRDIHRVVVEPVPADAGVVRVEYWRQNWPTPAPERRPGARRGWIGEDDPRHGHWTRATAAIERQDMQQIVTFDPIDFPEVPDTKQIDEAADYGARFRRTLKLRVMMAGEQPVVRTLRAETAGTWARQSLDLTLGPGRDVETSWNVDISIWHGTLLGVTNGEQAADSPDRWTFQCSTEAPTVRLDLLQAESTADATIVTVRTGAEAFSFRPADLADGPLLLPDLGVYIAPAAGPAYADYLGQIAGMNARTVYERVRSEPEQTAARAFAEVPPLRKTLQEPLPRYIPLGWDMNRQEFALSYNGHIFCDKRWLKAGGRDTARLLWPATAIHYRFATGDPPDFHEREDAVRQKLQEGYLPIVCSTWEDRELRYEQTTFVAPLDDLSQDALRLRGDEELVLSAVFRIRNRTEGTKRARLWFVIEPGEELELAGTEVIARGRIVPAEPVDRQWRIQPYPYQPLRARFTPGAGGRLRVLPDPRPDQSSSISSAVLYEVDITGFREHEVVCQIPFVSLSETDGARVRLADLDIAARWEATADYWRRLVAAGARIEVPDRNITDFAKAAITHVAITVDHDPESGLYMVPAATYVYGTCANESCIQIRQLDWRGYHDRARAYLETFLRTQSWRPLDGLFTSQEGVLRGIDVYGSELRSNFNYTLDHGFIMRQLAEHYWLTRDSAWVEQWAVQLVAACDFVIRERHTTMRVGVDGERVPEYGLLPAGHLEDNPEWRYWFAVNAWACGGLREVAAVLAETGHTAAGRLQDEAAAFQADFLAAVERARHESPVVRLRDGTAIPHTPTRTGLRGRAWGWIREGAYGPLHLVDNDLIDPSSREVTWILKDLEDNIFMSRQYGRPVDVERDWFSQGGVTIQANLLGNALAYLRRGEVEHAVRAFYNNLAASLYPDVRCFTEHPVIELGHGVGPFYKTPDECGFLNWLRQFLAYEERSTLHLARGVPREWLRDGEQVVVERMATRFGSLDYRLQSQVAAGTITAEIQPPTREALAEIRLWLRHPDMLPIQELSVEGVADYTLDAAGGCVVLRPEGRPISIVARYSDRS